MLGQILPLAPLSSSTLSRTAVVDTYNRIRRGVLSPDLRAWINYWAPSVESARLGNLYALAAKTESFLLNVRRVNEMQGGLVVLSAMLIAASRGMGFASATAPPSSSTLMAPTKPAMNGLGSYYED
jgi:hypothetical protein